MPRAVVFAPEATTQLLQLYEYLADKAGTAVADRHVKAMVTHCESLSEHSMRAVSRDNLGSGLRLTPFKRRAVIAYVVEDTTVTILGIFHGGQNFESRLRDS